MLLRHIRYLTAVVDNRSFTRAAQALHVSQPALSQQIKELEDQLGVQLLDRSGREVRPTDTGVVYLRYARHVLEQLDEAARAVRDVEDLSVGSLRLGVTPTVAHYLVGPLVERVRARHPGIELSIRVTSQEDMESLLRSDALDVGFGFGDMPVDDIEATPLHKERLALIARADTSSAFKPVVTPAELSTLPLALLDASFSTRRSVDRYLAAKRLRANVVMEANSVAVLLEVVSQTDLVTVLPLSVARAGLSTARFRPELELRPAALLRRRGVYETAAMRAFIVIAREVSAALV
ncbi:HTH-type transcriptional regulator CynR [Pararobbsia alpina]|uniref:transcriptional regulator CynR n=1 Tax=Pararobbsia alpina TaxID=621374 RepID=UPI0039A42596